MFGRTTDATYTQMTVATSIGVRTLAAALAFAGFPGRCDAQQLPSTRVQAIDGSVITFPPSRGGQPLLLLISFSHKSETECDAWDARLKPLWRPSRVEYYELVDFQGVPSLVMRLILHGVRRSVPKDEHSHFAPFYTDEDAWKKLAGYSAPEDAYLILADGRGRVLWQTHGPQTDQKYSALVAVLTKELATPP